MSRGRLESFSDGVMAVAITLLVLDLGVPPPGKEGLGHALLAQWPHYAAYLTSFATIGIIWINHHAAISRLRQADHAILVLNLLLLLCVVALPFATNLMAAYLKESHGQHLAAAVYSGAYLVTTLVFALLNRHILFPKSHLLEPELNYAQRRQILSRGVTGVVPYVIATALAAFSAYATLAICAAVAVFYALPRATGSDLSG
jgi:uncharacterized membrane protein